MEQLPDEAGQLGQFEQLRNAENVPNAGDDGDIPMNILIPVRILRGVFSYFGQLLLAADRFHEAGPERQRYGQDEQFDPPTGLDGEPPADDGLRAEADAQHAPAAGGRAASRRSSATGAQISGARAAERPRAAGRRQPATQTRFRSFDATGNVRILTPDMPAESAGAARPRAASRPSQKTDARARSKPTSHPQRGAAAPRAAAPRAAAPRAAAPRAAVPEAEAPEAEAAAPPTAPGGPAALAGAAGPAAPAEPAAPAADPADVPAADPADVPVPGYDGLSLPSIRARLRGLDAAQLRVLCDHEKSGPNRMDIVTMFERRIAKLEAGARDAP
jgi:hypothetical protein